MTLTKPAANLRRVILTAADRESGKTKSMTIYNADPGEVIDVVKKALGDAARRNKKSNSITA